MSEDVFKTFDRLIRDPKNVAVDLEIIKQGNVQIVATKKDGTKVYHAKIPYSCPLCQLLYEPLDEN